jgi:hypothetical protein
MPQENQPKKAGALRSTFNPIKEMKGDQRSQAIQWTTQILEVAINGLSKGKRLVANPFYENNVKLLKPELVFVRTKEETDEWMKCSKDIFYFIEKYAKTMTPLGIRNITLRDYQKRYLQLLLDNQLTIYRAARQSAKTTSSAMFLLWYVLFNTDKNAIVLGNKGKTAKEILSKVKQVFLEVPHFLKPGVEKWNENEVVFDNGCRILTETTVAEPAIGFTLHCVLLDEFAHIAPNIQEPFYANIFPTIDAANAKLMITSTQNGPDLFCRLFIAAENGENDFKPFTTNWDEVPNWNKEKKCWEKRDEDWRRRKVANLGSEEAFNEQYGCEFAVATNALIPQRILTRNQVRSVQFINKELLGVGNADCFFWRPDYDPANMRKDYIVFTTDIATGINEDYTQVMFNKLVGVGEDREPVFETVGYFRTNIKDDKECCHSIAEFINLYCHHNRYLYSFESNLYGDLWKSNFVNLADTEFTANFTMDNFIKFYNENLTKYRYGVYMSYKSKQLACKLFRNAYTKGNIRNDSLIFFNELKCFCDKSGNGTYKAIYGHDDMVMSQIQLTLIYDTIQFKEFLEEFIANTGVEDKGQNENFFQDIQPEGAPVIGSYLPEGFLPSSFNGMRQFADGMFEGIPGGNSDGGTLYDF